MGSNGGSDGFIPLSGSNSTFKPAKWNSAVIQRTFSKGDLVTLSPEFRYSIAITRPDFGRYVGIIIEAFSNREYLVHWTNQPIMSGIDQGMFNGDHLILVEHAAKGLMSGK
tara:strand:- start:4186 stop:4518 length:333 start_codon:yes stop_codon:yes gene_type:complete